MKTTHEAPRSSTVPEYLQEDMDRIKANTEGKVYWDTQWTRVDVPGWNVWMRLGRDLNTGAPGFAQIIEERGDIPKIVQTWCAFDEEDDSRDERYALWVEKLTQSEEAYITV